MNKSILLKFGEIIIAAYASGQINQAEQVEMLEYVNDWMIGDMVKNEEKQKRRKILMETKRDVLL